MFRVFAKTGEVISGVSISGGMPIRGAFNIIAGQNVTLTQIGSNTLSIASTTGGGGGDGSSTNGVTGITISGSNTISGAINFSAGQNVLLGINGNNITINATGANSDNIAILFGSKELFSGSNNETITFPNAFAATPKVLANIYNNSGQDILGFQLSGITTNGFSINLSETIPGTGYNLNYFASTGNGLYTFGQSTVNDVNNTYYVNSGSGLFVSQTDITSGISEQFISFPTILDANPTVVCSIKNSDFNTILGYQISGTTTSGYWLIFSDDVPFTGYKVNTFACNATGTGLATTVIINQSVGNLNGLISTGSADLRYLASGFSGQTYTVESISQLKSSPVHYDSIIARGYYSAGDGGGGTFYRVNNSTSTNSGYKIPSDTSNFSWQRLKNGKKFYVEEWGAKGDGVTDDAPAIQRLVDYLQANGNGKIKFSSNRTYAIDKPIIVANTGAGVYGQVIGLDLEGDNNTLAPTSPTIELFQRNSSYPCLILQKAYNCSISNLAFRGMNTLAVENKFPTNASLLDNDSYLSSINNVATGRYNPHAGIVTDPFSDHVTLTDPVNQYTGLSQYYTMGGGGCLNIKLRNCAFTYFVAGFVQNPNSDPNILQGDGITLYDCNFTYSREAIVSCQGQSKAVNLYSCGASYVHTFVSTKKYGRGLGHPPSIYGGQAGFCKQLFDVNTTWGKFDVHSLYCEGLVSIGKIGNLATDLPVNFDSCSFLMYDFTGRRPEHFGMFYAPISFKNCFLGAVSDNTLNFINGGETSGPHTPLKFENCEFSNSFSKPYSDTIVSFTSWRNVRFDNCFVFNNEGSPGLFGPYSYLKNFEVSNNFSSYNRNFLSYGGQMVVGRDLYTSDFIQEDIEAGISNITFNTGIGTATGSFSSLNNALLVRSGDNIFNRQSFDTFDLDGAGNTTSVVGQYVGNISLISGVSFFLKDVPKCWNNSHSLTSNTVRRLRRFHEPTTGTIANNTNALNILNSSAVTAWRTGDAIRYNGVLAEGTYITGITGNVFLLSRDANSSVTSGNFYDVKYLRVLNELDAINFATTGNINTQIENTGTSLQNRINSLSGYINNSAVSNIVYSTGNQTITGQKTFKDTLFADNSIFMSGKILLRSTGTFAENEALTLRNVNGGGLYLGTIDVGAGEDTVTVGMRQDNDGAHTTSIGIGNINFTSNSVVVGNANEIGNTIGGNFGYVFGIANSISQNNTGYGFFGYSNQMLVADKSNLLAIGNYNTVENNNCIAIGYNLTNSVESSIDIGISDSGKITIYNTGVLFRKPVVVDSNIILKSGLSAAPINNSGSILNLGTNLFYVHTGNAAASWVLPSISSSNGRFYYLKNKGFQIQITGNSATEYLFTHQRVQTIDMLSGNSLMLANDGQDWSVFNNMAGEDWGEV